MLDNELTSVKPAKTIADIKERGLPHDGSYNFVLVGDSYANKDSDEKASKPLSKDDSSKESDSIMRSIVETVIYMAISFLVIMAVRTFVVQHVRVSGTSMNPTLLDGEHLLIEKLSYKFNDIERFDIVVFRPYENTDDEYYVKRIIGMPGETIAIQDNTIYVNGEPLFENYGGSQVTDAKDVVNPIVLGKDEYFVLGDNREVSKDSRDMTVGAVKRDSIIGKAWYVIYPVDRVGLVEHD